MGKNEISSFVGIGDNISLLKQIDKACDVAEKNIVERCIELGNTPPPQAQGFFAEAFHAETFNVDAVVNRMDHLKAEILKSNELKSPDIVIKDENEIIKYFSSKYYKTGKESATHQRGYDDQGRLIPDDQLKEADKFLKDNPSDTNQEVREQLTSKVHHKNVESQGLERVESEEKFTQTKETAEIELNPDIDLDNILDEAARSGGTAAAITISMILAPMIGNFTKELVTQGKINPELLSEEFSQLDISKLTNSGFRAAVSSSVNMASKGGLLTESLRDLDPTMVAGITVMVFEGVREFKNYKSGEISGEVFTDRIALKSVSTFAGIKGAVIGQAFIPVPILGALIGAALGSILAHDGYKLLDGFVESYFRSESFEELKKINNELLNSFEELNDSYEKWIETNTYYNQIIIQRKKEEKEISKISNKLDLEISDALGEKYD